METNGKEKHLHHYQRIRQRPDYYRCFHPDCTHYIHKMYLVNRRASCAICFEPFLISSDSLRFSKLRCPLCRRGKPRVKSHDNAIENLLKGLEGID